MRTVKVDIFKLMDELEKKRFREDVIVEIIRIIFLIEEN